MKIKSRQHGAPHEVYLLDDQEAEQDHLTTEELQDALFVDEEREKSRSGTFPIVVGFLFAAVAFLYSLQQIGFLPGDITALVVILTVVGGGGVVLSGLGVLGRKPPKRRHVKRKRSTRRRTRKRALSPSKANDLFKADTAPTFKIEGSSAPRRKFVRSANAKLLGVAGGLGEYFNIDPTIIRIALVLGALGTMGGVILAYLITAVFMGDPEDSIRL